MAAHSSILAWRKPLDREAWWATIQCPKSVPFSSVTQSCRTLCDHMNCSTPGLPVHQQLSEFTQTHFHQVGDTAQPSHPLSSPSPPTPNPSQHQSLFQCVNSSHEVAKVLEFQISISPSIEHPGLISFKWTGRISLQSKGLSRVFSNTTVQKHLFFGAQLSSQSNSLSIHDHWKNHSLDQKDLCWQTNVFASEYAI